MNPLLFTAACLLAYTNGANDNFKGVASLFGSDTAMVFFLGCLRPLRSAIGGSDPPACRVLMRPSEGKGWASASPVAS